MSSHSAIYRRVHQLLRLAKLAKWRISRTSADDFWKLHHPGGAIVTIAARPTMRALLAAEVQFGKLEGTSMQELDT